MPLIASRSREGFKWEGELLKDMSLGEGVRGVEASEYEVYPSNSNESI